MLNSVFPKLCRLAQNSWHPSRTLKTLVQPQGCSCTRLAQSGPYQRNPPCVRWFSDKQTPLPRKAAARSSGPITWKSVAIAFGVGGALLAGMQYVKKEKELAIAKERGRSLGKASLGGPWELVDHNGKPKKSSDYHGKWVVLYFGFTHCPDICPDEIEKLVEAVDKIDNDSRLPEVVPIFITVDPERDTVKAVEEYVKEFSPKLVGMTGSPDKIEEATRAYRVYFSQGPRGDDNDYIVDHTIIMYLVNPDGNFTDYFGQNKTADEIVNAFSIHAEKFKQLSQKGWFSS